MVAEPCQDVHARSGVAFLCVFWKASKLVMASPLFASTIKVTKLVMGPPLLVSAKRRPHLQWGRPCLCAPTGVQTWGSPFSVSPKRRAHFEWGHPCVCVHQKMLSTLAKQYPFWVWSLQPRASSKPPFNHPWPFADSPCKGSLFFFVPRIFSAGWWVKSGSV